MTLSCMLCMTSTSWQTHLNCVVLWQNNSPLPLIKDSPGRQEVLTLLSVCCSSHDFSHLTYICIECEENSVSTAGLLAHAGGSPKAHEMGYSPKLCKPKPSRSQMALCLPTTQAAYQQKRLSSPSSKCHHDSLGGATRVSLRTPAR